MPYQPYQPTWNNTYAQQQFQPFQQQTVMPGAQQTYPQPGVQAYQQQGEVMKVDGEDEGEGGLRADMQAASPEEREKMKRELRQMLDM